MDSDEFVTRANALSSGLNKLADDLFAVAEGDIIDGADAIVREAKGTIAHYKSFLEELSDPDWEASVKRRMGSYIEELSEMLERIER